MKAILDYQARRSRRDDVDGNAEVDKAAGYFLQVLFALLIIFMFAAAILLTATREEVKEAQQQAAEARGESDKAREEADKARAEANRAREEADKARKEAKGAHEKADKARVDANNERQKRLAIENTDPGTAYVAIERIKIEMALEQLKEEESRALALDLLGASSGDVKVEDLILVVLKIGSSTPEFGAKRFADGCQWAQQHYSTQERRKVHRQWWHAEALERADLVESVLHQANQEFLTDRVHEILSQLDSQTRSLHERARTVLLAHYVDSPEQVTDEAVNARLKEYTAEVVRAIPASKTATPGDKGQRVYDMYLDALEYHVFRVFEVSGAPLLKGE